jgi:rod shape determining protein RodA
MIDRLHVEEIDWVLVGLVLALSAMGVVFIHSSSHFLPSNYALRQIIWIAVGLVALFLVGSIDYKFLLAAAIPLYVATTAVLAGTLLFTRLVAGTKSWITFGIFQVQPSELAKLVMILVYARLFAEYRSRYLTSRFTFVVLALAALPLVLIVLQPDLGTAITFFSIVAGAFILSGLKKKAILAFLVLSVLLSAGGWNFVLKDYQKRRLTTLLDPGRDPRGSGYQIIQSRIAIGSGGLAGKGYMNGSQSQLRYLPARHTDFLLSVVGEEFGFVGIFAVLGLYFLLLTRIFQSVGKSRDRAGVYIVFLAGILIAFQFFVNVLMIIGLFPVTGTPLPFLSYGGSSLLTNFLACGLVLNVRMRRFANV